MGLGIPAGFVYAYVPSESELIGKCRNQIILLGQQNKYGEAIFYSKLWQAIAQGDPQACLAEADLHKFKGICRNQDVCSNSCSQGLVTNRHSYAFAARIWNWQCLEISTLIVKRI